VLSFPHVETDGFLSFIPAFNSNVHFLQILKNLTLCMTKLRVLVLSFPDFTDISISFIIQYSV
jgi:hypothetical protein